MGLHQLEQSDLLLDDILAVPGELDDLISTISREPSPPIARDPLVADAELIRRENLQYPDSDDESASSEVLVWGEITLPASIIPEGRVWHMKLPSYLALETKPFDKATWDPVEESASRAVETDRAAGVKDFWAADELKVPVPDSNVIRWRWGENASGKPVAQSNSRIVEWSDGSLSLQIGAELSDIDIALEDTATPYSEPSSAQPLPQDIDSSSPEKTYADALAFDTSRPPSLLHVYNPLYSDLGDLPATVYGHLNVRPIDQTAKSHRNFAESIVEAQRLNKGRPSIMRGFPTEDPDAGKARIEKSEASRLKGLRVGSRSAGSKTTSCQKRARMSNETDSGSEAEGRMDGSDRELGIPGKRILGESPMRDVKGKGKARD